MFTEFCLLEMHKLFIIQLYKVFYYLF